MSCKYHQVSGALFGIMAVMHGMRVMYEWPAQIAGYSVPMWCSIIATAITTGMCVWAFRMGCCSKNQS